METENLSPAKHGTAELIEKRSRFIGNIIHVDSEEEALDYVKQIKRKYHDANHSAYAYITPGTMRYSDDGEPAKTAGLPILEMLDAQKITDCVCVVTRYFGGTLLGTGGLVRAYTGAAKLALEDAGVKRMTLHDMLVLTIPYAQFDSIKYLAGECGCEFVKCEYTDVITVEAVCECDKTPDFKERLASSFGGSVTVNDNGQIYL